MKKCDADLAASGEQTFSYTISEVATLELIQRDGILVRGKNITITKVTLTTYAHSYDAAMVTIGAEGVATYSNSTKNLDFSAAPVKAYYATAVETGKVTLSPTASVPAYTGIVVTGEEGAYEIPVGTAEAPATNYLKAVGDWDGTVTASAAAAYHFLLDSTGDSPVFARVNADTPIEARKAYLETTEDITPADGGSIVLVFADAPHTGLDNVQAGQGDGYYPLQGVRLAYPTTRRASTSTTGRRYSCDNLSFTPSSWQKPRDHTGRGAFSCLLAPLTLLNTPSNSPEGGDLLLRPHGFTQKPCGRSSHSSPKIGEVSQSDGGV